MLKPLIDVDRISCKTWATFAIERLFRGIRMHRDTGRGGECNLLQVVDCVVLNLNEVGGRNWYWPTMFAKRATAKGEDESYEEWVKDTRVVCRLDRFDGQLATCEKMFIPMHEGKDLDGHWILLVVYVRRGSIELWDSAEGARLTDDQHAMIQKVLEPVDRVTMQECMTGNSGKRRWISKGAIVEPLHVPKQANGLDCGVYVMGNMIYFGEDRANQYNSDEFRSEILLECLRAPNNDLHEVIQAAVRSDN
ncbi:hypothetical protein ACLB2K_041355 [Fragaria x ananassa]